MTCRFFLWDIVGEVLSHLLRQLESKKTGKSSLEKLGNTIVRIHVGLEDSEDLITDLDSAFKRLLNVLTKFESDISHYFIGQFISINICPKRKKISCLMIWIPTNHNLFPCIKIHIAINCCSMIASFLLSLSQSLLSFDACKRCLSLLGSIPSLDNRLKVL